MAKLSNFEDSVSQPIAPGEDATVSGAFKAIAGVYGARHKAIVGIDYQPR